MKAEVDIYFIRKEGAESNPNVVVKNSPACLISSLNGNYTEVQRMGVYDNILFFDGEVSSIQIDC